MGPEVQGFSQAILKEVHEYLSSQSQSSALKTHFLEKGFDVSMAGAMHLEHQFLNLWLMRSPGIEYRVVAAQIFLS